MGARWVTFEFTLHKHHFTSEKHIAHDHQFTTTNQSGQ